ncbi:MAG: hypothetical protein ACLRSW_17510 [Christensenellaceae bacterium]
MADGFCDEFDRGGKFNEKLRNYSCVEGVDIFDEPHERDGKIYARR